MNYYPNNLYGNYSYGAAYPQAVNLPAQNVNQNLLGKVVDGEDVVKATEVPFGGYGVFPKADLSELYIKSWNNDGTTKITTFKPVEIAPEPEPVDTTKIILDKITEIENKLNSLIPTTTSTKVEKRKELNVNAY